LSCFVIEKIFLVYSSCYVNIVEMEGGGIVDIRMSGFDKKEGLIGRMEWIARRAREGEGWRWRIGI
jgi:hypothetical protein